MIVSQNTLVRISNLLGLGYKGHEQDWELEFANHNRIDEFYNLILNTSLSPEEKYAIVALILASYDDYLNTHIEGNDRLWGHIVKLLDSDHYFYQDLLNYWALPDESSTDYFAITPVIRKYIAKHL